ncbi:MULTISPECIES: hypothetical protein [Moorena]|uniref:Type I restriction enzyme R protein N-terminal domain-containing protein n=1 Tax=Moorena producens 3L TaxID=489825 RepID=F4XNB7_9CYAN|nr:MULTISPECIES: hypothetical protein [Moorena]EGJ34176.1 hypothetical protein LYNGBM3L_23890 [Moorena producens 3L]NEP68867.1 hypothetical protein [Moorena sp. SIO3A5]NEQ06961.1 hypothetical protein [Moorena sp. SIO4E2]NER90788.1 hypothetical protein [Moorena sp. SIO3A2]NES44627.1 hypothetical protein [Moorena sp. SIO2C4]
MKKSIFKENRKYTFSDYFAMTNPTEEIVGEFGYSFGIELIDLPKSSNYDLDIIQQLNHTYYTIIPKISLTSEIAKREFLIAPLILEIAKLLPVKVNVEYPLDINDQLGGALDYLLKTSQNLIIIEAKKKDIDSGFNQLAAELIALDKYEDSESIEIIYGAVTLGDIWKFGTLDRKRKHIAKTIQSQTIPRDTEEIFSILIGILSLKPDQTSNKR